MNRSEHIRTNIRLQRRFEKKYFPKLRNAIQSQIDKVISATRNSITSCKSAANHIIISEVSGIVQDLYLEVGLQYARKTHRSLIAQKRSAKKGFGFNEDWVNFIKDFLFRFLIAKITFEVAETTRLALL